MKTTSTALSVNLNKIALLRNSREGNYPSVIEHAKRCIAHGADGITVHPRPDQRHIRPGDCHKLASLLKTMPDIEFNIEGNPFEGPEGNYPGFIEIIKSTLPDQATLVPDGKNQLTSDHGFDLIQEGIRVAPLVKTLKSLGVRVSLFMDPDLEQIRLAKEIGADRIELYTGPYAAAYAQAQEAGALAHPSIEDLFSTSFESTSPLVTLQRQLIAHQKAAQYANEIGLGVNAGHDLNLDNLPLYLSIQNVLEVSIGHALTVDSLSMGMGHAVEQYKTICTPSS
ncbi:pyridoxine 5'-phosphate synthase [Marinibactrum halimedae]|uniref:Pyridoxine 5'-phosphate synthase n=1 Tax=Marinibactrum halimedae TaxID=1444977 RepID=A0AA37WM06_9GAMM|nr:pyridoxine 5'-phosphate synthase [Marinibactrum halimedae]MCD9458421.1 pyridoxine 5'-phosphate synthase [Marinibactrum halimedae]GLS26118.1 pyridoxine 5'-phosphate synthase [Marinibactrum halimedae]